MTVRVLTQEDVYYAFKAVENGHVGTLHDFIGDYSHDYPDVIDVGDEDGRSLLIYACQRGQEKIVDLLIKKGASLDLRDPHKFSALHYAAHLQDGRIFEKLLNAGAVCQGENGTLPMQTYFDAFLPQHPELKAAKEAFDRFMAPQRRAEIQRILLLAQVTQDPIAPVVIQLHAGRKIRF